MRILLSGALAQRPGRGGHAWVFLNYMLGLSRLGHDVRFVDWLPDSRDASGEMCAPEDSAGWRYLKSVMDPKGLKGLYCLRFGSAGDCVGIDSHDLLAWSSNSHLLLNFNGFLTDSDILELPRHRVYVDIDPGFAQAWAQAGLHDSFTNHDRFVTVGLRVGRGSSVPDCARRWVNSTPPVVLSEWTTQSEAGSSFTTVASWRGMFGPVTLDGMTLGHRVHEFRRVFELPALVDARFEMALDIDPADDGDLGHLRRSGWNLVDPQRVAGDTDSYRSYITSSLAEFSVAKQAYVVTASGWFSDRSACYLAAGRPVVAQDTGWTGELPSGCGLLAWRTLDEAVAAVESVLAAPARHASAATAIARDYFDSDQVLTRLLDELDAA